MKNIAIQRNIKRINVLNYVRETFVDPKTRLQKFLYWICKKTKLISYDDVMTEKITYHTISELTKESLNKIILNMIQEGHSVSNLIILMSCKNFDSLIYQNKYEIYLGLNGKSPSIYGIDIRMVPYIDGFIVIDRKDLK